jgi:phage gp46-like protein
MDVRLYHDNDGGEIAFVNGQAVMSDGLETAAYLSMFGGNETDTGGDETAQLQWWGNLSENEASKKYRSETQALLTSIPAIPINLLRIKDAVERDLAWMLEEVAASVGVSVSIPALNSIDIEIEIVVDDRKYEYAFTEAWRVMNQ